MTETKVEVDSPADPRTLCNPPPDNRQKLDPMGTRRELEESLLLLADVALAPPCGRDASCSCLEVRQAGLGLQCSQQQLQGFLKKVEHLRDCLVSRNSHLEKQALAAAVTTLLYTCQPFFRRLESTARSPASKPSHLSAELLDFSQQLCERLEQLLLTYARYGILSVDEAEADSVSHFCIGRCRLGRLKLTIFRYCKPTPYLSRVDTGLYKRMRWNVERLPTDADGDEEEEESDRHTDYFFLCCEDLPNQSDQGALRVWSIGQWVQLDPDPQTVDLYDWILCDVPRGDFQKILCLGCTEPSSCSATDVLQQLLLQRRSE
uniref:Si:ch211-214c7.5 n=1 Tax=Oryzias latipes TaxID=8090 RepID=A0A3P9IDF7_ORYLA